MIARIVTGSGNRRQVFELPRDRKGNMDDVRGRLAIGNVIKQVLGL